MSTKGEAFAGLSVAITTPFRDSGVDFDVLRAQVDFQVEAVCTTCLVLPWELLLASAPR